MKTIRQSDGQRVAITIMKRIVMTITKKIREAPRDNDDMYLTGQRVEENPMTEMLTTIGKKVFC